MTRRDPRAARVRLLQVVPPPAPVVLPGDAADLARAAYLAALSLAVLVLAVLG